MVESDLLQQQHEIQRLVSELSLRHLEANDLAARLASAETELEHITAPFNGQLLSGYRHQRQLSVPGPDGAPNLIPRKR